MLSKIFNNLLLGRSQLSRIPDFYPFMQRITSLWIQTTLSGQTSQTCCRTCCCTSRAIGSGRMRTPFCLLLLRRTSLPLTSSTSKAFKPNKEESSTSRLSATVARTFTIISSYRRRSQIHRSPKISGGARPESSQFTLPPPQ